MGRTRYTLALGIMTILGRTALGFMRSGRSLNSPGVPLRTLKSTGSGCLRASPPVVQDAPASVGQEQEPLDLPTFVPTPASTAALQCIQERQLGHKVACEGVSRSMCRHGFPQAFVFHPSRVAFNSGLFRLSCPVLVRAVDEYEDAGGLEEFNYKLEKSPEMQAEFRRVNARHAQIRKQMAKPEHLVPYIEAMGQEKVDQILNSGLAGVTPEKLDDVKCLHANLADYLCTGENMIGKAVLEALQKRKVTTDGIPECWQQCDVSFEPTETSFWYTPKKNKQKLRQRHRRRLMNKRKAREAQEE